LGKAYTYLRHVASPDSFEHGLVRATRTGV